MNTKFRLLLTGFLCSFSSIIIAQSVDISTAKKIAEHHITAIKKQSLKSAGITQNSFSIARADNALVIPLRALGRRAPEKDKDGAQAYQVQVLERGVPVMREVGVGMITRSQVEVKSGLSEGEKVVLQSTASANADRTPGTTGQPRRMPGGARL